MRKISNHWIFLRGLSREAEHWGSFRGEFKKKISPHVLCPDFPGTGIRYLENSPSSIEKITDQFQEKAEVRGKPWIVALSLGCLVACEWMNREPENFSGAILVNASFGNFSPWYQRLRWQQLGNLSKLLLNFGNYQKREEVIFNLSCNRQDEKVATIKEWAEIQHRHPVKFLTFHRQLMAAIRWKPVKPQQPILILNSAKDQLVNPSCSEEIAKHWNLPLQTHPWGGHDLFYDDGSWVIEQIRNWKNL